MIGITMTTVLEVSTICFHSYWLQVLSFCNEYKSIVFNKERWLKGLRRPRLLFTVSRSNIVSTWNFQGEIAKAWIIVPDSSQVKSEFRTREYLRKVELPLFLTMTVSSDNTLQCKRHVILFYFKKRDFPIYSEHLDLEIFFIF